MRLEIYSTRVALSLIIVFADLILAVGIANVYIPYKETMFIFVSSFCGTLIGKILLDPLFKKLERRISK